MPTIEEIDDVEEEESGVIHAVEGVEDEDDDEDEDDEPVLLGFLEKPKNTEFLLRHFFPSKAGGVPVRPNSLIISLI